MRLLNKINSNPIQEFFLTANPAGRIRMQMRYLPAQQIWQMDLQQGEFDVKNLCVLAAPNMLRNYRRIITFGIAVVTLNGLDPFYIDDFQNGNARMYLLSPEEVAEVERVFFDD